MFYNIGIGMLSKKGNYKEAPNQHNLSIFGQPNIRIYSLFTGHGPYGHYISYKAQAIMLDFIFQHSQLFENPILVLQNAFTQVQSELQEYFDNYKYSFESKNVNMKFSGCSASIIIDYDNTLYIGHLGDSKAIIGQKLPHKKNFFQLTTDHLPSLELEKIRIYNNGGEVKKLSQDNVYKVFVRGRGYPGLTVSRSIGDEVASLIGVCSDPEGSRSLFTYLEEEEIINILNGFSIKSVNKAVDFLYKRAKSAWIHSEQAVDDISIILSYF